MAPSDLEPNLKSLHIVGPKEKYWTENKLTRVMWDAKSVVNS